MINIFVIRKSKEKQPRPKGFLNAKYMYINIIKFRFYGTFKSLLISFPDIINIAFSIFKCWMQITSDSFPYRFFVKAYFSFNQQIKYMYSFHNIYRQTLLNNKVAKDFKPSYNHKQLVLDWTKTIMWLTINLPNFTSRTCRSINNANNWTCFLSR